MNTRSAEWFEKFQIELIDYIQRIEDQRQDPTITDILYKCACYANFGQVLAYLKRLYTNKSLTDFQLIRTRLIVQAAKHKAIRNLDPKKDFHRIDFPRNRRQEIKLYDLLDTTVTPQWTAFENYQDSRTKELIAESRRRNNASQKTKTSN